MIKCPLFGVSGCAFVAINAYNVKIENCNGNTEGSIGYLITGELGRTYNWGFYEDGIEIRNGLITPDIPNHPSNPTLGIVDIGDNFTYSAGKVYQLRIQGAGCGYCNIPGKPLLVHQYLNHLHLLLLLLRP